MLTIVIVNWNSGTQLAACLRSVAEASRLANFEVETVVVDNASTDDSAVDQKSVPHTQFLVNTYNRGFAAACNQGAERALGKYILFLNPDMRLDPDALAAPVAFMERAENGKIAICGINLRDESGGPSTCAARFPSVRNMVGAALGLSFLAPKLFPPHLLTAADIPTSRIVDQVIGAYFLVRREVFCACAGFDEQFFVYFEEVDLSKRIAQLGYLSYSLADVSSFHKGGGCSEQVKAERLFYSLRSRLLYAAKHFSIRQRIAVVLLTSVELPLRLARAIFRTSVSDAYNTVQAYRMLIKALVKGKNDFF